MLILGPADVEALLDLDQLAVAVGAALVELSAGRASAPERIAVPGGAGGMLLVMPAHLPASAALTTKLVTVFPGNVDRPTHQAMVCCFDPMSGAPVAVIDGEAITAARTAAVSALATQLLARADAEVVAVVGSGVQARAHVRALMRLDRRFRFVVAGRDRARVDALVRDLAGEVALAMPDERATLEAASSIEAAVRAADVVCLATHSATPVIRRAWLADGTHVNSVGFNPAGEGEVDQLTAGAATVAVESRIAAFAEPPAGATELRLAVAAGRLDPASAGEIGELLAGHVASTDRKPITLYKSVGVAVEDAAAAALVLAAARAGGRGVEVPW